ncbi:flagellar motor protein MotB [Planosporangium thailandense]|uniref:Flagellar motor protein MotB n=1 Tax=Planosporangium thailandense TaxID=765197 RepID=A0ABX0Y2I4_9ACTN|nr:flagellar motor protein MotB [Planosporangium thailandense]NJC71785.1 flagellar motor protein MotB [Planosporangium thailandense]
MSNHKAGHGKRRGGGHEEEEHVNHERWLVTYGDMLTLLMVLFVVLFAMSQIDMKKFTALRDGLAKGFGAPAVMSGTNNSVQTDGGSGNAIDVAAGVGQLQDQPQTQDPALQKAVQDADRARQQRMQADAQQEASNLEAIKKKIQDAAAKQGVQNSLGFAIDERGLVVTIVTSDVVFAGDRADLLPAGQRILDAVAPALVSLPNHIEVDGHTNQLPVPTKYYPSAWELSTARASDVVRYLINHGHLSADRMSAAGFAGERPLYPPSDPRAPTLNRRVDIVVLSTLPPAERALLPSTVKAE